MPVYEFISGVRDRGTEIKELAISANQSAVSTLKNVVGWSQKLLNTSNDLSRVNATLRETDKLLQDSSMTSMSGSAAPLGKSALSHLGLPSVQWAPCSQTAFPKNGNALMSGFTFIKKEKGLGYCVLLVHFHILTKISRI